MSSPHQALEETPQLPGERSVLRQGGLSVLRQAGPGPPSRSHLQSEGGEPRSLGSEVPGALQDWWPMGPWVGLPGRQAGQGGLLGAGQTFLLLWYLGRAVTGGAGPMGIIPDCPSRSLTGDCNIQGKPLAPWVSPRPLKGPEP